LDLLKWLKNYFELSRRERNGIAVLLGLILCLMTAQFFIRFVIPAPLTDFAGRESKGLQNPSGTDSLTNIEDKRTDVQEEAGSADHLHPFAFNPNTLPEDSLKLLGLSPYVVSNLIKYRNKGGYFHKADDLVKIYGLDKEVFEELKTYVVLGPAKGGLKNYSERNTIIELNTADSLQLLEVKGIGPYYASKILQYREALGGFVNKEQLKEIYGMDQERYDGIEAQLSLKPERLKTIDLNRAGFEELRKHPYIRYKLAKSILALRDRKGGHLSARELKSAGIMDEAAFDKLRPYLKAEGN
jgi:DNA uptake protein ComE-like DNA-binding protein